MGLLGNSPKSAFMLVIQLSIMMLNLLTYTQSEPYRAVSELILQIMIVRTNKKQSSEDSPDYHNLHHS